MRPAMKLTSGVFTLFAACAATPTMSSDELGFVHERIRLIGEPEADGTVYIGFELSAKTYWIDAKLSPDAAAMLAFAKSAKDDGRLVYATYWARDQRPKSPETFAEPGIPNVLLRLADDPDPRRPR